MSLGVRKPYFAGQFYERKEPILRRYITSLVSKELNTEGTAEHVRAVILPHAGYCFSAQTAVKTLLKTVGSKYSKVLVIAPSHRVPFQGIALSEYDTYRTPLGDIPVDMKSVEDIVASGNDYIGYMSDAHEKEHSLEVELPLLQHFCENFELIPIISGMINEESARSVAMVLKKWWRKDILWVISSDFTHFGYSFGYVPFSKDVKERLHKLDLGAVKTIVNKDLRAFCEYLDATGATICGRCAIQILLAVLELVNNREKSGAELVHYCNSGELTSDYSNCVSYAGIAFFDHITET
jgi:AmmeMemoRadiSam system protein B